jgi:hypothetical protein
MEVESMVHALKEVHRLLKPDGVMIDMHPVPEAPVVEVMNGDAHVFSESLLMDSLEGIMQAEIALKRSVEFGLFVPGKSIEINYRHYASSPAELRAYWETIEPYSDTPKHQVVNDRGEDVFIKLDAFIHSSGEESTIAIDEKAYISLYMLVKE